MKSIQRIILWTGYVALVLIANPVHLQAQTTPYTSGDLTIGSDGEVPSNVTRITRIDGNLTIIRTITTFPNFAALEVVEGDLYINGITTTRLTALTNIFPALDSVRGDLFILGNDHLQTITGFEANSKGSARAG